MPSAFHLLYLRAGCGTLCREGNADAGSETCADQLLEVTDDEGKPLDHEVIMVPLLLAHTC